MNSQIQGYAIKHNGATGVIMGYLHGGTWAQVKLDNGAQFSCPVSELEVLSEVRAVSHKTFVRSDK